MINSTLNNTINSMSKLLAENKDKIIAAAKKRAEEELGAQMQLQSIYAKALAELKDVDPTVAIQAIQSVPAVSNSVEFQKVLLKVEGVYNKSTSLIDKALKKLEDGKKELTSIKTKLSQITDKLDFLDKFTDPLNDIFGIISDALKLIDGGLALNVSVPGAGGTVNGGIINKLGELKKDLKDLVTKGKGSLDSISGIKDYFDKETNKILDPLNKGISGFEKSIQKIQDIRNQIADVYEKFIASLILPQLNNEDNDNELLGNENLSDYIKNEDNLSTVLSDALIVTKKFKQ